MNPHSLFYGKTTFKYQVNVPTPVQMLLRPRRQEGQSIVKEEFSIEPAVVFTEYSDYYGNQCQRAILPSGEVTITTEVEALVESMPFSADSAGFVPVEKLPDDTMLYLLPSRYCPSDLYEINQLAWQIVGNLPPGYAQVEAIRSWIYANIRYEYGTTNSTTTALDIARQWVGVCRDFAHLSIALCRTLSIPTRMVVGYLDKLQYTDLHAWFEAYLGDKWYTFDAVQAQTEGYRVVLGYGRDAADVAMITQFGNMILLSMEVETRLLEENHSA
ncbi:MAG: transglutaminase family protein [Spirosomataceae bacterium]